MGYDRGTPVPHPFKPCHTVTELEFAEESGRVSVGNAFFCRVLRRGIGPRGSDRVGRVCA